MPIIKIVDKKGSVMLLLSVSYFVNGNELKMSDLKNVQITKRDYIDYVESIINKIKNDEDDINNIKMCVNSWQNRIGVVK